MSNERNDPSHETFDKTYQMIYVVCTSVYTRCTDINVSDCWLYTEILFFAIWFRIGVHGFKIGYIGVRTVPELAAECDRTCDGHTELCPNLRLCVTELCLNLPELCPNCALTMPELLEYKTRILRVVIGHVSEFGQKLGRKFGHKFGHAQFIVKIYETTIHVH